MDKAGTGSSLWLEGSGKDGTCTVHCLMLHFSSGKRQRKRWEDNIREWTGLEFTKSQRAVENREKWRKLVAKSSVVPQRASQLKDR